MHKLRGLIAKAALATVFITVFGIAASSFSSEFVFRANCTNTDPCKGCNLWIVKGGPNVRDCFAADCTGGSAATKSCQNGGTKVCAQTKTKDVTCVGAGAGCTVWQCAITATGQCDVKLKTGGGNCRCPAAGGAPQNPIKHASTCVQA